MESGGQIKSDKLMLSSNSKSHIISMHDISKAELENIFKQSDEMRLANPGKINQLLQGKKVGLLFFQPSTRTRFSFESAMLNLGGNVLGFSDSKTTRAGDYFNESIEDTIRVISQMVDCIVIRHFECGSAKRAAFVSTIPIINGGDGSNEHPTQALLDLWIMKNSISGLNNKTIGLIGDPSTRVLRSMIIGLTRFKIKKILFLLPPNTPIPEEINFLLTSSHITYEYYDDVCDILRDADAIEILPINLPNLNSQEESGSSKNLVTPTKYRITRQKIKKIGKNVPILHPGPRLDELAKDVDDLPQILYFEQVRLSIFMRMALLHRLIRGNKNTIYTDNLNKSIKLIETN